MWSHLLCCKTWSTNPGESPRKVCILCPLPLPEGKMLLIKTVGDPARRMRLLAREVHQEQMAQDRSGLSSSLAALGVKRVMQVGTAVSGMAKQGSQRGDEGDVL